MELDVIYQKSCQKMPELPDESIDLSLTSPPYWGLRDYGEDVREVWGGKEDCEHKFQIERTPRPNASGGKDNPFAEKLKIKGVENYSEFADYHDRATYSQFCLKCGAWHCQLGLEPTFQLYLDHMMIVCAEIKRVLKKTGSFWLNMGDTYSATRWSSKPSTTGKSRPCSDIVLKKQISLPSKCLLGIPWRLVLRLIDEQDWILRNAIIWSKPNSMPSSVKDRLSNSYEFLFHLVKNTKPQYYWNEETGLMADRKPPPAKQKEGIDWDWVEIGEDYSVSDTKINSGDAEKFNSPRTRVYRQKKRKKRTYWHSLGYWYDLDAIREKQKESKLCSSKYGRLSENNKFSSKEGNRSTTQGTKWSPKQREYNPAGKNPSNVWTIPTQPRPEAHFACVSSRTECLTLEGWKLWYQLRRGEKIASYNLEKQLIEYQCLSSIKTYNYDAELIKVGNRDLDILMTHNHRNVVSKRLSIGRKEIVVRADELAYMDKIRVRAPVDYPENQGIGKSLASLLGWIISEGHFKKQGGIELYQNKGEGEKVIDAVLTNLDVPHSKKTDGREIVWYIPKSYCQVVKSICPEKKLSRFLISLPLIEAQSLFNALVAGDGHTRKDDGRIVFIQKDKETVDWFSILALRLGYHSIISKDKNRDIYRVYLTNRTHIGIHSARTGKMIINQYYHGKIWCPSIPNGTWVARRNGKMFITGNTFPDKLCIKPILATCPAEICKKCGKARMRITKPSDEYKKLPGTWTEDTDKSKKLRAKIGFQAHSKKVAATFEYQTIGWTDCGCNAGWDSGVLLDPFAGRGTALIMAKKMGRHYVGYELSKEYCIKLIQPALDDIDPLFQIRKH